MIRRRHSLIALVVAVIAGFVVYVLSRLDAQAFAVVVGVVCGIAAAIPASLALTAVALKAQTNADNRLRKHDQQQQPFVVIQGGQPLQRAQGYFPAPVMDHELFDFDQQDGISVPLKEFGDEWQG